jgi:hypothetical protein
VHPQAPAGGRGCGYTLGLWRNGLERLMAPGTVLTIWLIQSVAGFLLYLALVLG